MADDAASPPDPQSILRSRQFRVLLILAAIVGAVVSAVAWGFLELVNHIQPWVYTDIPNDLGFDSTPLWWSLPVLAIAGVLTALAIERLPGRGGHVPAEGLNATPAMAIDLPGVFLAGLASISLGIVLGPEAPLMGIGSGLGYLALKLLRRDVPDQVGAIVAVSAMFAALAFLFGSPIIAAIIIIEAAGLGGAQLPLILLPGLLASGIGSLVWIGMGSWTGLNTAEVSITPPQLPAFARPDIADFGWTIALALMVALGVFVIFRIANELKRPAAARPLLLLPAIGLAVAGLAIAFHGITDHSVNDVLFSGENQLDAVAQNPQAWSVGALAWLIVFKGIGYGISLSGFRGGPVFPALFLGAIGGMMAAQLPGFELTPAVGVGMGTAVACVLRLPLAGIVLGILLTSSTGAGVSPLIIVGVVVGYLATLALPERDPHATAEAAQPAAAPVSA